MMGVDGQPAAVALFQYGGDAAWPLTPLAAWTRRLGVPGTPEPEPDLPVHGAMELIHGEGEVANGAPDVAPLILFEGIQPDRGRRLGAEPDHIRGKDRPAAREIDFAHARLHLRQPLPRNRPGKRIHEAFPSNSAHAIAARLMLDLGQTEQFHHRRHVVAKAAAVSAL